MHVRTEPLGGSTLAATIGYEEPRLRPYRPFPVHFARSMTAVGGSMTIAGGSVRDEVARFRLIFLEGSVWDVARIASTLELWPAHDPLLASIATSMSRFDGSVVLRETQRVVDADDYEASTWADLSIDDAGRPRRDAFELFTR